MLFDDTYITITEPAIGNYKDKGSRFIAIAFPVSTEQDVKLILQQQRKEHPKANHHCYAYRLGIDRTNFRIHDDGEPSGTAGRPILSQLLSNDLTNILIVVVRYFGGSLLGVPGLIHAYKSASKDAIVNSVISKRFLTEKYNVTFDFELINEIMNLLKINAANVLRQEITTVYSLDFEVRKSKADELIRKIKMTYKDGKIPVIKII